MNINNINYKQLRIKIKLEISLNNIKYTIFNYEKMTTHTPLNP